MEYLIRDDEPFRGYVQSVLKPDGSVAYTDGWSPARYAREKGFPVRIIGEADLDRLLAEYTASLVTEPTEETEEQWTWALECLPPCKWRTVLGVEMFHISERVSHDIVAWHARIGDRFFTFNDHAGANMDALAAKVAETAK